MSSEVVVRAISQPVALVGVKSTIPVLIEILTSAVPAQARPAIQISCVMDRSGSMAGSKIKYAKRAIKKLIKHLEPPHDALHLVIYDTESEVSFEDGDLSESGKEGLKQIVRQVFPNACTNLHAGMVDGANLLLKERAKNTGLRMAPVKRILLFSDGLVNAGVRDPKEIVATTEQFVNQGLTVSTFGIGKDVDEDLMIKIAKAGKGEYAFLESFKVIPKLVSKSIHGTLSLVGTKATLSLRGLSCAVVTRVFGEMDEEDEDNDDNEPDSANPDQQHVGQVNLGDLHADNTRRLLLEIEVTPSEQFVASAPRASVLEYELEFFDPATQSPVRILGHLQIDFTSDKQAVSNSRTPSGILAAHAIHSSVELDKQATKFAGIKDVASARASKDLAVQTLANAVASLRIHLEQAPEQEAEVTADIARVEKVLARTQEAAKELAEERVDLERWGMQQRYMNNVHRALSDCGNRSGCDSDEGRWSDSSDDEDGAVRGSGLRQNSGLPSPPLSPPHHHSSQTGSRSVASDDSGSDGEF
eukprot:c1812_g1_i1.p1 GENE.c1812_g1_i1~~c1812_g1_i1.p1  ORF type:complete len:554 (+),score=149.78 c1812_g1_i1:75-1664(+)